MSERSIIHIDMDAFYASVEQRDFPQYRGKPLVVGGDPNHRGVVATCSYEARKFGIHSAMACAMAKRKCPHAIFVQPRFQIYREVSTNIQDILRKYTDLIEPLALDEAFLDVTKQIVRSGSSMLIAKDICQRIKRETHLTASAGVSYNKFLAKIASDRGKPDGLFYVSPKEGPEFVKKLTIREFFGVGPATEEKMQGVGIYTGADLATWELEALQPIFGKSAEYYYNASRGIDGRAVEAGRLRKSIGTEDTFEVDLHFEDEMLTVFETQSIELEQQLKKFAGTGKTVTIKVKFSDFSQVTRSHSSKVGFRDAKSILSVIPALLESAAVKNLPVRLLGISISNLMLDSEALKDEQISLW
jgi:DNA polymerase-4